MREWKGWGEGSARKPSVHYLIADFFYPGRWWAGYGRFFCPGLRGKIGNELVSSVYEACFLDGSFEPVLRILTMGHLKNVHGKDDSGKGCVIGTATSMPTKDADEAVKLIIKLTYGITESGPD